MTGKKTFILLWILFFACLLMAFSLTGVSYGQAKGEPTIKEMKEAGSGKAAPVVQGKKRAVPLSGSSLNKVLPPPCTVTAVRGTMVTLKDFHGQMDTIEVADAAGIKVGEKAVVKNGSLILGIVPE